MAEAEVARIQSQSLTSAYIRYRELQILEKLAESDNKVFVPSTMLDSVAGQVQLGRQ
jgi:chorismate mutase